MLIGDLYTADRLVKCPPLMVDVLQEYESTGEMFETEGDLEEFASMDEDTLKKYWALYEHLTNKYNDGSSGEFESWHKANEYWIINYSAAYATLEVLIWG